MAKIAVELPRQKYLLHQTNSGTYLMWIISNRQLLESDLKLRTFSVVKYYYISERDIEQAPRASHTADHDSIAIAETLYGDLQFNILPPENDLEIISYVTGYTMKQVR